MLLHCEHALGFHGVNVHGPESCHKSMVCISRTLTRIPRLRTSLKRWLDSGSSWAGHFCKRASLLPYPTRYSSMRRWLSCLIVCQRSSLNHIHHTEYDTGKWTWSGLRPNNVYYRNGPPFPVDIVLFTCIELSPASLWPALPSRYLPPITAHDRWRVLFMYGYHTAQPINFWPRG